MFSRIKKTVRKAGRAVSSISRQGVSLVKEGANRFIGLPGYVVSRTGFIWPMKMQLRVVILRDENNNLVADPKDVRPSIEEAQKIFKREANVRIQPFDNNFILPAAIPAPREALDVRCNFGAFLDELGKAGSYFKRYKARTASSFFTGYATPITVFVVRSMKGKKGCALGPSVRYVVVSVDGLGGRRDSCGGASEEPITPPPVEEDEDDPPIVIHADDETATAQLTEEVPEQDSLSVQADTGPAHRFIAHELAHMCGLLHSSNCNDLMHNPPGTKLTLPRKAAIVRNSRFVTTL